MLALAIVFTLVGVVSAIVGLGGGTFYLLSMELFRLPIEIIPVIALTCNIFVSGIGSVVRLSRRERCSLLLLIIIIIPSMGMAYVGASLRFQEGVYRLAFNILILLVILIRVVLLGSASVAAKRSEAVQNQGGLQNRGEHKTQDIEASWVNEKKLTKVHFMCMGISASVGFVSGIIGIGGGIILGPVLYMYGMSYRSIPVITSTYIFLNSSISIIAHLQKIDPHMLLPYLFLPAISIVVSLISMLVLRIHSQVRNIALTLMIIIALYNIMRVGLEYAG